jgi:hypothetical protein
MFSEFHRAAVAHVAIENMQSAFEEADYRFGWASAALGLPPYDDPDDAQTPIESAQAIAKTTLLAVYLLVERDQRRGRPGPLMQLMRSCKFDEIAQLLAHANLIVPWSAGRDELSHAEWRNAHPLFLPRKRPL